MERLRKIMIGGKGYPCKCTRMALEQIEEDFGSLTKFVEAWWKDGGHKTTDINAKTVLHALAIMINEGIEVEADELHTEAKPLTETYIKRNIDITLLEAAEAVWEEFNRAVVPKK